MRGREQDASFDGLVKVNADTDIHSEKVITAAAAISKRFMVMIWPCDGGLLLLQ